MGELERALGNLCMGCIGNIHYFIQEAYWKNKTEIINSKDGWSINRFINYILQKAQAFQNGINRLDLCFAKDSLRKKEDKYTAYVLLLKDASGKEIAKIFFLVYMLAN